MQKVDALQVIMNTSAIFGIGLVWFNLNEKVFKTVCSLAAAPFSRPKKETDSSSDCSDEEEGDQSDACRGAMVILEEINNLTLRSKKDIEEHLKRRSDCSDEEEGDQSDACRGTMVVLEEINNLTLQIKKDIKEHLKRRQKGLGKGGKI